MTQRKAKRLRYKGIIAYFGIVLLIIGLNVLAWNSTAFCDWYIAYIFPIGLNTYGRVTGLFPFSVGEWLLVAGVVLVVAAVLLGLVWVVIGIVQGVRCLLCHAQGTACLVAGKADGETQNEMVAGKVGGKSQNEMVAGKVSGESQNEVTTDRNIAGSRCGKYFGAYKSFTRGFYRFFVWTLLSVCLIMTLNCFILYHASTFSEKYFGASDGEYSLVEVIEVYNLVAEQCNSLSKMMERDGEGTVLYSGSVGKNGEILDMQDMAREMMQQLGETYPQLDGYYPRPKALLSSDFMCQQYMCGYYFPFSLEANYNDVMYILNKPATMCHELAHLRGYIYEDEANFISFLACTQSEDIFFQYAGYLSVLVYLNNDLYAAWQKNPTAYEEAVAQVRPIAVDNQVWIDNTFVTEEEWERINGKALIDTEVVEEAADVFIETNLQLNGVSDGKISYSRVVKLLLQYYHGH